MFIESENQITSQKYKDLKFNNDILQDQSQISLHDENTKQSKKIKKVPIIKKSDFLNEIDKNTEDILINICEISKSLENSIDKINNELISLKNFKDKFNMALNKQKILIKSAKIINKINIITVELNLIEDIIKTLKLSNCNSLSKILTKFENASQSAPEIIQDIQDYLKNKDYSLSIFILSN